MIVLDYIKTLKNNSKEGKNFFEILEKAQSVDFNKKSEILTHFESINIKEKENFIHLKYNTKKMFKQPWDEFYMNTRALVVDWVNEEIVLYPFDKFFELDEHTTTKLNKVKEKYKNGHTVEITEKIDGSLIVVRFYKCEFFLVSSGSFEGAHVDIAYRLLEQDKSLQEFIKTYPDHTFMLEMKNMEIPQLIKYGEDKLTVIGMRDMTNFHLLHRFEIRDLAKEFEATIAPEFNLSVEEMLEIINNPKLSDNEGYILRIDDFLVKMKSKNFILANRFAGEPTRNFNMVIEAINEGRVEAIRSMIRKEFIDSFDMITNTIKKYIDDKETFLNGMFEEIKDIDDMSEFVKAAQSKFFPYVKELVAMKKNFYNKFSKEDINYLKKFANKFTCVSHFKYAELNDLLIEDVVESLENGTIKFLHKFYDSYNKQDVYIIHKWQWLDFDTISFKKETH